MSAIAADGWQSTVSSPTDLSFTPFTVSRAGFDATGTATTIVDTLKLTKRVRLPYPNQAALTADKVALSDYVYQGDVITGATNNSTEVSPKPVANWGLVDRRVVGNTLVLEVVAFHRNARAGKPVAAVVFRVTDGTTTVTQTVSALTVSPEAGDQCPVLVYRASIDISTLADNVTITANAKVYPHVGVAASVLDSADQVGARDFSPRTFVRNTSRAANPPLVYVASTGNDTTGYVGTDAGLAAASPCLTLTGAVNRARTVLGTATGSLDGLRVRLTAGTWSRSASPTSNTVNAAIVIEPAPGTTKAEAVHEFGVANNTFGVNYVQFKGITMRRMGAFYPFNTAGGHCTFEDVAWDSNGNTGALSSNALGYYFTGGTVITGSIAMLSAGTAEIRMLRGVTGGAALGNTQIEAWLWLGNILRGVRTGNGSRGVSGRILAFNKLFSMGGTGVAIGGGDPSGVNNGVAIVQNVIEWASASNNVGLGMSADSDAQDTVHVIIWHNTILGHDALGRSNLFYDETAGDPRSHRLQSIVGNIHTQLNTKHDVFMLDGTRVGGWGYLNGVGVEGEVSRFRDAGSGSFAPDYAGINSSLGTSNTVAVDMLFTNYRGTTAGPVAGAGDGDYSIAGGSPAKSRVADARLGFDIAGAARGANTAAGAFA